MPHTCRSQCPSGSSQLGGNRSFDDLVGANENRWRHSEAERVGGLQINHQLNFGRLLNRQIGRSFSLQNLPRVNAGLVIDRYEVNSIADQAAGRYELSQLRDRRYAITGCECCELPEPPVQERIRGQEESSGL